MFVGMGANSATGYTLNNSLRFRSSASAYLSRTFGTATNSKVWTYSAWIKRGTLGVIRDTLFSAHTANNDAGYVTIGFNNDDKLTISSWTITRFRSAQVFRDVSAWYHIIISVDTTNAIATDRLIVYVNGERITAGVYSNPTLNASLGPINTATQHTLFSDDYLTGRWYYDGYGTEVNFVDGQALTPTDFGEFDNNGTWVPKKYTGTYGTNGFYLDFEDTSSVAALGTDSSGNGNTWTVNNVSLTAGTTYDSMSDVPTLTDEDTANFATLNPLSSRGVVPTDGNLTDPAFGANQSTTGTIGVSSGKWYFEVKGNSPYWVAGVTTLSTVAYGLSPNSTGAQGLTVYSANGSKYNNGSATAYGATYTTNDIMAIALDLDAGTITWYKNNVSQGVAFTGLSGTYFPVLGGPDGWAHGTINFGQRPFAYTPPTGFKKLNTYNLPDSIKDGSKYFNTVTYTGDGNYPRTVNGFGFQPDFVWFKARAATYGHFLFDVIRGVGNTKFLSSSGANAEGVNSTNADINSFDSDGYVLDAPTSTDTANANNLIMVSWAWKAGGTAVSNTNGTITSTVSANPTAGFSVVSWTGNATAGATIGHGLGVAPNVLINKNRNLGNPWVVYHSSNTSAPETDYLVLNTTAATVDNSVIWNDTAPTSSVFTVGSSATSNGNGNNMITYCFAEVEGYSKFGSYTGNGSTNGTFVYTGFRPAFIMWKRTDTSGGMWQMMDTTRDTFNVMDLYLQANSSNAEADFDFVDFVSNGFKHRHNSTHNNASGGTYIYMAFAENPFKNSLAR